MLKILCRRSIILSRLYTIFTHARTSIYIYIYTYYFFFHYIPNTYTKHERRRLRERTIIKYYIIETYFCETNGFFFFFYNNYFISRGLTVERELKCIFIPCRCMYVCYKYNNNITVYK